MSKEMREQINKVKNFGQFINENIINDFSISEINVEKIIAHIQSLSNSYKLKTRFGDSYKLYDNGIDTALNNSRITNFYLKYHKNNKKSTTILPTPSLDVSLYEKLNNLIKLCDLYSVEEDISDGPKSLMNMSDNDKKSLNNRLFRVMCFQAMNILLYEDYFNTDFKRGNGHKIINELHLPINEIEFYGLFDEWNDRNSEIRGILFYADAIPVVSVIEKY